MRGRCVGGAWEDLPLPQHIVREYRPDPDPNASPSPNPNPNPSPSPKPEPNSKGLPLPQHIVREYEAVRREEPTPAQ